MLKTTRIIEAVVLTFLLVVCAIAFLVRFIPKTIVVPDHYTTIRKAIAKARSGDTVFVRAGIYKERLIFKNGIKLVGEGMDQAIIQYATQPRHVILVENCNEGLISNLCVQHGGQYGAKPAVVAICLANSSSEVSDCRISKASSSGIYITNGGNPIIYDCVVESNPSYGIVVSGRQTNPMIRNNLCRFNKEHAIYFYDGAQGKVEGNNCVQNGAGIAARDAGTTVSLTGNNCLSNEEWGICIWKEASTTAENNVCEMNKKVGIYVAGKGTSATLRRNTCERNGKHGICFSEGPHGVVEDNECRKNEEHGIDIQGAGTEVIVRNNHCRSNKEFGIVFWDNARGAIERNICEENEFSGIFITKVDKPVPVRENTCRANYEDGICFTVGAEGIAQDNICINNDWRGIQFFHGAKGAAEGNVCEGNGHPGILIHEFGTIVNLRKNICKRNYHSGIVFANGAGGEAVDNTCENNPWSGIAIRGKGVDPNLAGNRCNNNGVWGIIYWAGAQPVISNNNITLNNGKEGIKRRD